MNISQCLKISLSISLIFILNSHHGSSQSKEAERVPPVVSAEWLKQNISKPGIIILHITTVRPDYQNGHIPGAQFLWPCYVIISTEYESNVPAPAHKVTKKLRELGVNNDSHIILCGINGNIVQVCRVFVSLEHYGLRGRVSVLNGGFEEWINAGYESSTATPDPSAGRFRYNIYENLVNGDFVRSNMKNGSVTIIDARSKSQYEGIPGTMRTGHIPGASNLSQTVMYDPKSYMFHEAGKIREAFEKIGIPSGTTPLVYCNTGNSASVLYVAALTAGLEPLQYDGSMEEWSNHSDWPVENKD